MLKHLVTNGKVKVHICQPNLQGRRSFIQDLKLDQAKVYEAGYQHRSKYLVPYATSTSGFINLNKHKIELSCVRLFSEFKMPQTKIGQFFKKSTTDDAAEKQTPQKKIEQFFKKSATDDDGAERPKVKDEGKKKDTSKAKNSDTKKVEKPLKSKSESDKTKVSKGDSKSKAKKSNGSSVGVKRKSNSTSSDEEEDRKSNVKSKDVKKHKSDDANGKSSSKRPRRRIVVNSSSSESEAESKSTKRPDNKIKNDVTSSSEESDSDSEPESRNKSKKLKKSEEKAVKRSEDKSVKKSEDKSVKKSEDKSVKKSEDKSVKKSEDKSVKKTEEKPVKESEEKSVKKSEEEESEEEQVGRSKEKLVKKSEDKSVKKSEKSKEKPAAKSAKAKLAASGSEDEKSESDSESENVVTDLESEDAASDPEPESKKINKSKEKPKASRNSKKAAVSPVKEKKVCPLGLAPSKAIAPITPIAGWNANYDPTKSKYHPIDDASWEKGQKVPYLALAKTLEAIEATSSRLRFIEILANYLRSVIVLSPDDLVHSVYLCLNKLAPAYEGVELGIAETNIMKAIAQATGRSLDRIKADAGVQGDLGLVAESSRSNQKTLFQPQPLTVSAVFYKLKDIAGLAGHSVQAKKVSMITSMLVACKYSEARYLTRSLAGKLRIGLAEQSLLQALSQACFLTPPNQDRSVWPPKILNAGSKMSPETLKAKIDEEAIKIKSCYCECPSYEILVKALLKDGVDGISEHCKLTPGIPTRPMLAQPTKGVHDVMERFDTVKFTCEYKYDGERAQIHLSEDGTVNIYSRNQENNTSKYPDIISRFKSCLKGDVKSCILDSEATAWDLENECILPFQVLSTRKRKDANEAEIKVQVFIFAFDLIYLNGQTLIKEPLMKRRELLRENFQEVPGQFGFATSLDTDNTDEVQEFLEDSIKGNCEGLMVKTLDVNATYELAKRSQKWLKLKKDYLDSGGDSLDLVVIGGFLGKGKRTGSYGGFLLACYEPDNEEFQTVCKLGTGFSDEQLVKFSETMKEHIIKQPKPYYRVHSTLTPDHWFDAVQVWEVKCADLSLSPIHTGGAGIADPERGISLRFPRFLRIREDKNVEDATSAEQVAGLYRNQEQVKNQESNKKSKGGDDEEDFY